MSKDRNVFLICVNGAELNNFCDFGFIFIRGKNQIRAQFYSTIFRYHAYHFTCTKCNCDLDHTARDVGGKLYCLPCHDKMEIPICATCRRPIEGRCVNAMGKQFHPEHFVCVACERPFANSKVSFNSRSVVRLF